MAKTLKDFLEGYLKVKSADEQKFIDKHVTAKNPDRNGNGDDVFKGSTKTIDRRKDRKGYNPGEDEKVYEALKGNQHKIDANKNGKVDAHDFKLLRKKKKVAEEAEQIDEILDTPEKVADYKAKAQKSFSKNVWKGGEKAHRTATKRAFGLSHPKVANEEVEELDEISATTKDSYAKKAGKQLPDLFKKSGETADGARKYYNRKNTVRKIANEEVEQIDELEKKTLGSYIKKASGAERPKNPMNPKSVPITTIAAYQGDSETGHFGKRFNQATYDKAERLRKNRETGIKRATDKLTKEEVEELDEISATTKDSYAQKAGKQLPGLFNKSGKDADSARKYYNRKNTVRKIANEEVEELDEKLTAKTPMGTYIKDFKKSDAPQFKGKSQDKRRVMAIAAKLSAERGGKPLRKEERLQNRINDLTETHQRTLMHVFEKLSEDNKSKFLEACDTPEGVEQMLDFAINNRGE